MGVRLPEILHLRITQAMKDAIDARAKRLNVRWQDVARMALALDLGEEPGMLHPFTDEGEVPLATSVVGEYPFTELADHIAKLLAEREKV